MCVEDGVYRLISLITFLVSHLVEMLLSGSGDVYWTPSRHVIDGIDCLANRTTGTLGKGCVTVGWGHLYRVNLGWGGGMRYVTIGKRTCSCCEGHWRFNNQTSGRVLGRFGRWWGGYCCCCCCCLCWGWWRQGGFVNVVERICNKSKTINKDIAFASNIILERKPTTGQKIQKLN